MLTAIAVLACLVNGACLGRWYWLFKRNCPHKWTRIAAQPQGAPSGGGMFQIADGVGRTVVLQRCSRCDEVQSGLYAGHWTLDDLNGTGNAQALKALYEKPS